MIDSWPSGTDAVNQQIDLRPENGVMFSKSEPGALKFEMKFQVEIQKNQKNLFPRLTSKGARRNKFLVLPAIISLNGLGSV